MEEDVRKVVIMGAGGRDFHVFNTCYRKDSSRRVIAFTAGQIPHIDARTYPASLAGPRYPEGIPVVPEADMERLVRREGAEEVVFAYSDVPLTLLDEWAARVGSWGASFHPFDVDATMLAVGKPSVAVCATRTGAGKSPVSRRVASILRGMGLRPAVVRHPMPYGNLRQQVVQRFGAIADFATHKCTLEEMEEYEPHILAGNVVFAGVDYEQVFAAAVEEGDVLLWDGGNNDTPFLRPDLWITVADPLRPGHELTWFPSRANLERADVVVIHKADDATAEGLATVRANIANHNPKALVVDTVSLLAVSDESLVRGKRVLVVEDGPTMTHGGLSYGAGFLAATRAGAAAVVDPRPFARGEIAEAFRRHPHLHSVLPALGYAPEELADLEATIDRADCDAVVIGTPVDLSRLLRLRHPKVLVRYEARERGPERLPQILQERIGAAVHAAG
jgi:predicted GTPase